MRRERWVLFTVPNLAMSPLKAERTPDQSPTTRIVDFAAEEATIAGIHAAVAAGRVTCVQVLQAHLQRIEAYDQRGPALNAILASVSSGPAPIPDNQCDRQRRHKASSGCDQRAV